MSDFRFSKAFEAHACCDACWRARCVRQREPLREPVRVRTRMIEACCFCGALANGGIYVRTTSDPTMLDAATSCRGHR